MARHLVALLGLRLARSIVQSLCRETGMEAVGCIADTLSGGSILVASGGSQSPLQEVPSSRGGTPRGAPSGAAGRR